MVENHVTNEQNVIAEKKTECLNLGLAEEE